MKSDQAEETQGQGNNLRLIELMFVLRHEVVLQSFGLCVEGSQGRMEKQVDEGERNEGK